MTVGELSWPAIPGQKLRYIQKVVAAAATPEAISSTSKRVRRAAIYGIKDDAPSVVANTSVAFMGDSVAQFHPIMPYDPTVSGNEQTLAVPSDGYIDLSKVYIKVGTNGDGVLVAYVE